VDVTDVGSSDSFSVKESANSDSNGNPVTP